jgi:CheY-like chemotaxis protein
MRSPTILIVEDDAVVRNVMVTVLAHEDYRASVITSKPAICDHFKTGQRSRAQDMKLFYRAGTSSGKFFSISL